MTEAPPPPPSGDPSGEQPTSSTPPQPPPATPAGGFGAPPPASGYGAPPPAGGYASQSYGGPPPVHGAYAEWPQRVIAALIDNFVPFLVAGILYVAYKPLGLLAYVAAIAWTFYQAYQGGETGQSLGKKVAGIRLIHEQTGQTIGGGLGIGRALLHIVDGIPCYLGYLWPLWDAKKQTFADKILTTVVLKV